MSEESPKELEVAVTEDYTEVVLNVPHMPVDSDGRGWISFFPEQAERLANTLLRKSFECRRMQGQRGVSGIIRREVDDTKHTVTVTMDEMTLREAVIELVDACRPVGERRDSHEVLVTHCYLVGLMMAHMGVCLDTTGLPAALLPITEGYLAGSIDSEDDEDCEPAADEHEPQGAA